MVAICWTLLLVLVTITVLGSAHASGVRETPYQRNAAMDGLQPTSTPLFQGSARSTAHCAIQCRQVDGCHSYTFTADQPSSCRGYDVALTSSNADIVSATGAKTFQVVIASWQEIPCSGESGECPVQNSECFKGQCLCTPGYYYSVGSKLCLADCPEANLGVGFTKYKESVLSAPSLYQRSDVSVSACLDNCLHNAADCRAVTHRAEKPQCWNRRHTALTKPAGYRRDSPTFDHYQRTCA